MSDLRIKVKYYDIEIETVVPFSEVTGAVSKQFVIEAIETIIDKSCKTIDQLIETGRKTLTN